MSCREWEDTLNELVDGSPERPEEAERHLSACDDCRRTLEALRDLRKRAAELPREEEPSRDLWPEIRAGLGGTVHPLKPRPASVENASRWWMGLAAAAILVVGFAAGLMLRPVPVHPSVLMTSYQDAESEYLQVTGDLLRALDDRRSELSPETLAVVEENLRIIDEAIQEVRSALEEDPGNAGSGHRFTSLYGRKVALLKRAVALPAES